MNGLHGAARGIRDICGFRFLMGAGECGNYSAGIKIIFQCFPPEERALAGGIFNSGTVIGALIAPPIILAIFLWFGWRMAFVLPSVLGLLWIILWLAFCRKPEQTAAAKPLPILPLLRSRHVWGAIALCACCGPVLHFYRYWLPEYLKRERHFSMNSIALLAGGPIPVYRTWEYRGRLVSRTHDAAWLDKFCDRNTCYAKT